jgi:hypothetical protein
VPARLPNRAEGHDERAPPIEHSAIIRHAWRVGEPTFWIG